MPSATSPGRLTPHALRSTLKRNNERENFVCKFSFREYSVGPRWGLCQHYTLSEMSRVGQCSDRPEEVNEPILRICAKKNK